MQGENWADIDLALRLPHIGGDVAGAAEFRKLAEQTDWSVMSQFQDALFDSQQRRLTFHNGRYLGDYDSSFDQLVDLALENDDLVRAGLESILAVSDDMYLNKMSLASLPQIKQLPWGTRLNALLKNHREVLEQAGPNRWVISEFHNPHTVGSRLGGVFGKGIRVVTERTPQTHIFFDDPDSVTQFERVVTQANRLNVNGTEILSAQEAANLVSNFSRLKRAGRMEDVKTLYNDTVERINNRLDKALEENNMGERLGKGAGEIDPQGRTLTGQYRKQNGQWGREAEKAVGVSDDAGVVTTQRLMEDGTYMVIQHRMSKSQVKNSAVQPRYDVVQRKIELAQKRQGSLVEQVPVRIGDAARGVVGKSSQLLDTPQQAWRSSMLLTPKWPMRVGLDEQLRAAAVLGGITQLGNLIGAFPELRRAFALHNLDNIDAATDAQAITELLAARVGMEAGVDDAYDIFKAATEANPDAIKDAVSELRRQKVLSARDLKNRKSNILRLSKNAAIKGIGVGALMGNPLVGAAYGFVAFMGKRRRVNDALQRKAALNYAETLRFEGERMLREAVGPEELAEARRMMDDATHINKLIDSEDAAVGATALEAKNAFDSAEKLMADAGVHGLNIGGVSFRNAFGDDTRYQEQIRAEVSSSRSQSALFSGAIRDAERQLRRFEDVSYTVFDAVKRDADGVAINAVDISREWANMMNRYTSGDPRFLEIVWSNDSLAERATALEELLRRDSGLLSDLTSRRVDDFADDELMWTAENIIP
jgi:hypothetical protein